MYLIKTYEINFYCKTEVIGYLVQENIFSFAVCSTCGEPSDHGYIKY